MEHRAAGFPFGLLRSLTNCSRSGKERESSKKVEQLIHIWTKAAREQEIESFPAVACIVCVRLFKGNKASYSGTRYRSRELSGFSQVHLFILSVGQCIGLSEKEYGGKEWKWGLFLYLGGSICKRLALTCLPLRVMRCYAKNMFVSSLLPLAHPTFFFTAKVTLPFYFAPFPFS